MSDAISKENVKSYALSVQGVRIMKRSIDRLPSHPGKYKSAQYDKINRPDKDIPF